MSYIVHTQYGAFCSVCQSHLSLEEEYFLVCDACGGEGFFDDDDFDDDDAPACRSLPEANQKGGER